MMMESLREEVLTGNTGKSMVILVKAHPLFLGARTVGPRVRSDMQASREYIRYELALSVLEKEGIKGLSRLGEARRAIEAPGVSRVPCHADAGALCDALYSHA